MSDSRWSDLGPRMMSGLVMVVVGTSAVIAGGIWFHTLVALICGLMIWELVTMLDPDRRRSQYILALATMACGALAIRSGPGLALPLLMLPSLIGLSRLKTHGASYALGSALILLAGYGLMSLRDDWGAAGMLWLVLVVVGTDVAGYFAGRLIGGPKLWPRVSPKKTWSGAIAGWSTAAVVGCLFAWFTEASIGLIGVSIALSMASQVGDMAESSLKRRVGVKDSSALIPGHGGVLDRFDGMLGAAVFMLIAGQMAILPLGAG